MINRRQLLKAGAVTALTAGAASVSGKDASQFKIIDCNLSLFQWPFRHLPLDNTDALLKKMRVLGIKQGWASSLEAILHRDLASVNHRLAAACKDQPELVPIGSINLTLPDWSGDLRHCAREYKMPGIRLHPGYHGYTLADPRFADLLEHATKAGMFVQIAAAMEDPRTQHPSLRAADVDLAPLPKVMHGIHSARVQILNLRPHGAQIKLLAKVPGIYLDTARIEGTDGVPALMKKMPAGRVLFGTHTPLLIPEAALIRTHEAAQLDEKSLRSLFSGNARLMLNA